MGFNDEYLKLRKKRLEEQSSNKTQAQQIQTVLLDTLYPKSGTNSTSEDIAPVRPTTDTTEKKQTTTTDERKWFQKGAFEDGYQFGDILKTVDASAKDLETNILAGVLGIGEGVVDAGAYLVGGVGSLFNKDFGEKTKEFISKDLYDQEEIARKIVGARTPLAWFDKDIMKEENSVFGEKTDSLAQSGGQLLGTAALGTVGVPWFLTTGVTSFGGEVDNAFDQGANYGQAGLSAAITAGAEILSEKLSGGINFGAGTVDDLWMKQLTTKISNKALRTAAKFGLDVVGEGLEEAGSQLISNLGSALYREENLMDILWSEEALDGYLESFIGGGVLGGGGSVHTGVVSAIHNRDATSGMTAREEAVFKKIYDARIEEAQKNAEKEGKKLSVREKNKIYDEVLNELDRGYVSTDTIEEVLGGESYTAYKKYADQEDALQKEFDKLGNMKKGDFTAKQDDRYNELKQKLAEMKESNQRETLKAKLSEEVQNSFMRDNNGESELIDKRLYESYAERARRGQAFEADLSKYDAKQQETIKKAVESGILNNTNRTHEFVDMVSKISADKGVLFDFTNNERLKESGFAVDGKEVNGYVTKDGITVNIDSHKALNTIVGHEVTHVLEGTEHYAEMQKALFQYAQSKGDLDSRRQSLSELYKNVKDADVEAELTADLVGDYLFTDRDFVNHLARTNRNVFQKIYDEIKHLWDLATAGSKEARELEKAMHLFEKAYKESGKAQSDTKYSLSDSDGKQLTKGQQEFLKDSKIRDYKGNILVCYHATDANFTVFDKAKIGSGNGGALFGKGFYFTPNRSMSEDYGDTVGQYYLNIKNPFEYYTVDKEYIVDMLEKSGYEYDKDFVDFYDFDNLWDGDLIDDFLRDALPGKDIYAEFSKMVQKAGFDGIWAESEIIAFEPNQIKRTDNLNPTSNPDIRYSLSDSDGKKLTTEQQEYFKDSKMRDENGNLKVMYHGSQDAGFHVFDPAHSDDDTSLFFVDRNDVAASYSGTTETYEAQSIRTAEDMNKFIKSIDAEGYEVVENNGKFTLLYEGDRVADSKTAKGIYEEFCWYEGVGDGDANYKVYLNLTNPLEVDGKGRPWNKIDAEFSQEVYDKYKSLTAEEKAALTDLAEWEDFRIFNSEIQEAQGNDLASAYAKMGEDVNIYDLFSVAADNFSEESMRENARRYLKTRDFAQRAKEQGYDGVIFKNIIDNGGYSNGDEGASTVAIAFDSNQIKSVANDKPTKNADIRYSLSSDSEGRTLSDEQKKYFNGSKVVDANGNLKVMHHGSPETFTVFDRKKAKSSGTYGNGFYFTDSTSHAATYGDAYDVYLNITNPLQNGTNDITKDQIRKFVEAIAEDEDYGIDNYGYDATIDSVTDSVYGKSDFAMILDLNISCVGNMVEAIELFNKVNGTNYDGIIAPTETVAFYPNQIKSIDNLNPTGGPDIRYSLSEYTAEEKKAHNDAVVEHFGKTYKWAETGYLLLDGTKLDLSGKHDGAPGGYRTVDHRDITEALGYDYGGGDYSGSLVQFMSEGNIRIVPEINGFNLSVKPTKAQEQALSDYISRARGEVVLDIDDLNGNTVVSVEYPRGTYYAKVLNDIREWFDNGKQPETSGFSAFRSLTKKGEPQKRYGNFNISGDDVRLEAPMQEQVAPMAEDAPKTESTTLNMGAPITEDEANALQSENIDSLTDADAPPEMEAPYYGETEDIAPKDPFDNRDIKDVGNRKVKAYMYENPEVKPFFQKEANIMLGELRDTTKGERIYTEVEGGVPGEYGAESYGVWTGTSRQTSADIEYLLDTQGYSYAQIEKGLNAIIEDNGAENNAVSKRIEFLLNDRLMNGYQTMDGYDIPADQDYINLLNEKQITEYSEEARKSFFDVADAYAPQEDIAPVKEQYEAIKPKQTNEPKMARADKSTNGIPAVEKSTEPVTREVFNKRFGEVYGKIKGLSSGKYHKVGDYGFHLARSSAKESATITVKTPDGKKLRRVIDGGNFWKNARLWSEAARMVAENEYPNVEPITAAEAKKAKLVTKDESGSQDTPGFKERFKKSAMKARTHLVDNYSVFEDLELETGNTELYAKANFMRYSENMAQRFIGRGADGVRAINDVRKEVEASGLYDEFKDYMYEMLNTDRMSIEDKAKPVIERLRGKFEKLRMEQINAIAAKEITAKTTDKTAQTIRDAREYLNAIEARNKAVFGWEYTAQMSREAAAKAEAEHPQFKKWAQDIYDNMKYLRKKLVEDGEISQETADLLEELYPHYVPIRRSGKNGAAINVPLDTNKTGVNAPIKRATGGDSDIEDLFYTIGTRIIQTYKAGAKNRFGVELMNTLGTRLDQQSAKTSPDEAIEGVENHEERLKKGENGRKPTFTVFENGKRVEFEITEEMYDALKPANELFTGTNKALSSIAKFTRKLLTEWNLVFAAGNATKDAQDLFINSQHPIQTYAKVPESIKELYGHSRGVDGKFVKEYMENGGEDLSYFDGRSLDFKKDEAAWKKVLGFVPNKISELNNFIERVPRLAEYIASREAGASIEKAMLDAARVTTNFAAGGDVTKWANRNGFNFLNASVQGAAQHVRNVREAKAHGLKGMLTLAAKVTAAGLPFVILNSLLWDDDEDYEELSDYVKDNYYIVAKYGDGKFVRIPKGRAMAVIQSAFTEMGDLITGNDEVDLARFGQLMVENLAPNNPLENNIFAPIGDVIQNKTWYGEDLVPTRLQDLPAAEQYDETTDSISKWLGENLNMSPYKINYLLNQYSGGVGDVVLPMLTPKAESGDNSLVGNLLAPWKDKFTTDSVLKNQNVSDFYDTVDELAKNANSMYATDEDVLKSKYMNSINAELGELYKKKREIQNSGLSDADKYEAVRDIQKQIDELAEESLNSYGNVNIDGVYATVGDLHFRWYEPGEDSEAEPGWQKISDKQLEKQKEVTSGLGISPATYWSNKSEYDFAYEYPEKYAVAKSVGGYEKYKTYTSELYDIKADKDEDGKSITGSRKEKVAEYINNLDADYGEKIILFKSEYNADDTYNYEIIDYLNNREDISYEEMVAILKELGFTVKGDTVTWD